jgi:hypothetical protein
MVMDAQARTALVQRVKNIILQPKLEWPQIAAEPATVGSLYTNYVVYLAAVPVVSTLIRSLVFGYGFAGVTYRPSVFAALWTAVVQYGLQLGGVFVFALIIDALAPRFGGQQDRVSAFKLAAYSATASWLAGVFTLIPGLSFLSILGLYSLYLLYTGVPVLMRVPAERAMPYTIVIIVIAIVISLVAAALVVMFLPHQGPMPGGSMSGQLNLPGGVTVDMGKLDEAAKRLEQASKRMEQAQPGTPDGSDSSTEKGAATNLAAIDPNELKSLLPPTCRAASHGPKAPPRAEARQASPSARPRRSTRTVRLRSRFR